MKFRFVQAHIETARLYHKMYGESYYSSGCSYRGLPPEHGMTEETEDQKNGRMCKAVPSTSGTHAGLYPDRQLDR